MLGARIDAIQPQIKDFTIYLVSPPDKKTMTAVVKHDKTSGLDKKRSSKMLAFAAHTSYKKKVQ